MALSEATKSSIDEGFLRRWARMLRPLSWWALLVLVLFAIRMHERLMADTQVTYSLLLDGRRADGRSRVEWDGQAIESGANVTLGRHTLTVYDEKAEPYSREVFVWYGPHAYWIPLRRSKGTIILTADPAAAFLSIRGPEFTLTLTNSTGGHFTVPTDRYEVEADYARWKDSAIVAVSRNGDAVWTIAPPFGGITLACNQEDAAYDLQSVDGRISERGKTPATVTDLPAGEYVVDVEHHGDRLERRLAVKPRETNQFRTEFVYGTAHIETEPSGAVVCSEDGRRLGVTPLTLGELHPGELRLVLTREEYESVTGSLHIEADKTNVFETNLLSRRYVEAMLQARTFFSSGQYDAAAKSAHDALGGKPEDAVATAMEIQATGLSHVARAKEKAGQGDIADAIAEMRIALKSIPDNPDAKALLFDYESRKKRADDEAAQEAAKQAAAEARAARIADLESRLDSRAHVRENGDAFSRHEVIAAADAKSVCDAIRRAFENDGPVFQINPALWLDSDTFVMEGKQDVDDGHRVCLVLGGQLGTNETLICFKSLEYQNSHTATLLGGLVTASVVTPADQNGERAARFQAQIKEGASMVAERIRKAILAMRPAP